MNRCLFTPLALQDLIDIHDHIAADNPEAALRLVERLDQRCEGLADMPGMGRRRDDLSPTLRSVPEGSYVLFYRPLPDGSGVEILRVLHGARDLPSLFEEQGE